MGSSHPFTRNSVPFQDRPSLCGHRCRVLTCILALVTFFGFHLATAQAMPAAKAGLLETGAPSFVVLGPEALGMSTAPRDMHVLPDGRVLLVSQNELVFGDGVRWEAFRADDHESPIFVSVAWMMTAEIYAGIPGGIARDQIAGRHALAPDADSLAAQESNRPLGNADFGGYLRGSMALVWRHRCHLLLETFQVPKLRGERLAESTGYSR